jgi:hypothetical protein
MLYEIFKGNTLCLAATSVADVKSTFDKLSPTQAQYVYKTYLIMK